jgi:DNA-directed RNA polymerase-3 subunit RPC5
MNAKLLPSSDVMNVDEEEGLDIEQIAERSLHQDHMQVDDDEPKEKGKAKINYNLDESSDSDSSEEDEVVQRYEVFLSHTLTKNMHVLQYPSRPTSRPYDFKKFKEMTYKPNHKKLDITFEINTHSEHFNQDTMDEDNKNTFTLTSNAVPLKTNYAVGIIRGNQLQITPLQSILQLRPSTEQHGEGVGVKEKVVKRTTKKEEETQKPQQTLVHQSFRTQADERERQKSWTYLKQNELSEKAIQLEHYGRDASQEVIAKLFDNHSKSNSFSYLKF